MSQPHPEQPTPSDETEIVFIVTGAYGSKHEAYHTDPDCGILQKANNHRPVPKNALFETYHECAFCNGTHPTQTGGLDQFRTICRACWTRLNEDGTCTYCERFDAVFSDFEYFDAPLDHIRVILE